VSVDQDAAVGLLARVLGATVETAVGTDGADRQEEHRSGGHQAGAEPLRISDQKRHLGSKEQANEEVGDPGAVGGPHSVSMAESAAALLARVSGPGYRRWLAGAQSAAGCVRPVRLRPSMLRADPATGELTPASGDSPDAPDGVIYKACGDRRASVCPACSERYRADTWQVIAAGLRGGKGVPAEVAGHPAVFLTLTAPSFGLVHSRRTASTGRVLPCRPRRKPAACLHGRELRCPRHHEQDEGVLGLPLCLDCYDHAGQVVWNAHVGELWRRTVIGLRRELARVARSRGTTVRVSYAKVAEFQRRGVVHLHALLRLDGIDPAEPERIVPPHGLTIADLEAAVRRAAGTAFATEPHPNRPQGWRIGWGEQLDIRPLRLRSASELTDRTVVAYLAKYATKSTETTGHVSKRLTASTVDLYADPRTHTGRLIDACWTLGGAHGWDGLRRWAHMLGFGGHFGTRSRRYSTTLRALRAARRLWRRRELVETRDHTDEETTLVVGSWTYSGTGWRTTADALLATSAAARARERRRAARDATTTGGGTTS
jgi:hypothetical protein